MHTSTPDFAQRTRTPVCREPPLSMTPSKTHHSVTAEGVGAVPSSALKVTEHSDDSQFYRISGQVFAVQVTAPVRTRFSITWIPLLLFLIPVAVVATLVAASVRMVSQAVSQLSARGLKQVWSGSGTRSNPR
jgi:hypothetical protein